MCDSKFSVLSRLMFTLLVSLIGRRFQHVYIISERLFFSFPYGSAPNIRFAWIFFSAQYTSALLPQYGFCSGNILASTTVFTFTRFMHTAYPVTFTSPHQVALFASFSGKQLEAHLDPWWSKHYSHVSKRVNEMPPKLSTGYVVTYNSSRLAHLQIAYAINYYFLSVTYTSQLLGSLTDSLQVMIYIYEGYYQTALKFYLFTFSAMIFSHLYYVLANNYIFVNNFDPIFVQNI